MCELAIRIKAIGAAMAACKACDDLDAVTVTRGTENPPRGLILQGADRTGTGCIFVGINPGRATPPERAWRRERPDAGYAGQIEYFAENFCAPTDRSYYGQLRKLPMQLALTGPILWTEVVKCENTEDASGGPSAVVQRMCAHQFLMTELQAVPEQWPVIAAGDEAFRAMCLLAPGRAVIGVPHPSGGFTRHRYNGLFEGDRLIERHRRRALDAIRTHKALQLKEEEEP